MVILSKQSSLVTYGNTIILEAKITSHPAPVLIVWKKDNKTIDADDQKYVIDNSHACISKLSIRSLDFDDNGKYTVFVNNALGSTHDETNIDVKGIIFKTHYTMFLYFQYKLVFDFLYSCLQQPILFSLRVLW